MAANKSDLFDKEQVPEAEARQYAAEIGAVFKLTSACQATGIEELFKSIGCKILNPNYKDDDEGSNSKPSGQPPQVQQKAPEKDEGKIKLDNKTPPKEKKKGGFC